MKSDLSRRGFLHGATALGLAAQAQALGLPLLQGSRSAAKTRSVVVIFLRGGADFLNMIVPLRSDMYELKRPGIAIRPEVAVKLDSDWGLHPALQPLASLYEQELFLPIINAGSTHPTRSHFDAQDFMCYAAPGNRTVRSGWLNRYLAATQTAEGNDFRALGMQRLLPTSLRGEFPVLAVPDEYQAKRSNDVLDYFEKFYGADGKKKEEGSGEGEDGEMGGDMDRRREPNEGVDVVESGKVTIETLRRYRDIVSRSRVDDMGYPQSRLGEGLKRIGQVLLSDAGLEVAGIDYGGWDHHANQGGTDGPQARMLRDLGTSLAAFRKHLGETFENTMVVVMTEFGRTVIENGSGGTDHGHGSGMFLLGGGLKGGQVFGDWDGLRNEKLYEGRDLPVSTDFRDVFNTVLREHLDFKAPKEFFPGHKPKKLKLFA